MPNLWARELRKAGKRSAAPALITVVVVLPVWLADWPGLAQPAGAQGWLRAAGIIAGALGAGLWVASLMLILRFPAVDRYFGGLERQYFSHHLTGTLAYLLLLAHPPLLAGAAWLASPAAGAARAAPWGQPLSVGAGWLALVGLMLMFFATFFTALAYQRWKLLHAASGIAYLFAFLHMAWLVPPAGAGRNGTLLLLILMTAGLAALAVRHRLDRGALAARAYVVEHIARVSASTVEATLTPRAGTPALDYAPGQFVYVAFDRGPGYAGCREYHPFTIRSAPHTPGIKLLIKALGDCTRRMQHLKRGARARVQGPYGGLFREAVFTRRQIWLGGGIGVAPFLAMAEALAADAARVDFYYLARSAADAPGLGELTALAAERGNLRVYAFVADESAQTVYAAMCEHSAPLDQCDVYVCGPPAMLAQWLDLLQHAAVPADRIHAERFDFR